MRSEHCQEMFRELGQSWEPSVDLFKKLQAFTCKLYTSSTTTVDINTARLQRFCSRRGELESTQLLPCEDCLFMHTMRANYQAGIWRCSLQQHLLVPCPVKRGWVRNDDGQLTVEWMRDLQLPMQCYSCCCASAAVDASFRNGSA